ncbi:hypothetical protein [Amycolatopsis sp. NPDC021455]|uniref:hypothetical protein n=1 Tax=Amycolatopsis sp. NPDC021455 TaxID=3154901 RepID=UPI0033ED511E
MDPTTRLGEVPAPGEAGGSATDRGAARPDLASVTEAGSDLPSGRLESGADRAAFRPMAEAEPSSASVRPGLGVDRVAGEPVAGVEPSSASDRLGPDADRVAVRPVAAVGAAPESKRPESGAGQVAMQPMAEAAPGSPPERPAASADPPRPEASAAAESGLDPATAELRVGTLAALAVIQAVLIVVALRPILPVVTGRRAIPTISGDHHGGSVALPAAVSFDEWLFLGGLAAVGVLVALPLTALAAGVARRALARLRRDPGGVAGRLGFAAAVSVGAVLASVPVTCLTVSSAGAREQPLLVTVLGTGGFVLRWFFPLVLLFGVSWLVRAAREEEKTC